MEKWINLRLFHNKDILNTTTMVYLLLLDHYSTEFRQVVLNADRIEEWCKKCELPKSSFYRGMRELIQRGIVCNQGGKVTFPEWDKLRKQDIPPMMYKR